MSYAELSINVTLPIFSATNLIEDRQAPKKSTTGNFTLDDSFMALEIIAFVSFPSRPNNGWASEQSNVNGRDQDSGRHWPGASPEKNVLFPTESDLLLSSLEPFRDSTEVQIKVYDLSTTLGWFQGLLNSVFQAPAVIIDGKRHMGWKAAQLALSQIPKEAN